MKLLEPLAPATIDWRDDGPWSDDFNDRYASHDALAEARYVFVDGNDLPRRFAGLDDVATIARHAAPRSLRIAEIGFGFGVNLLVTLRQWRAHAAPGAALHYLALEHTPVARDDLVRRFEALGLLTDAAPLLASLPPALTGFWRIAWPLDRVFLTLGYGDAATVLADRETPLGIDAWYLDGFSPRCNADAFTDPDLLGQLARHSAAGATLATYTAAGSVRRSLQAHGWRCARRPGFGHKREHLVAQRATASESDSPHDRVPTPRAAGPQRRADPPNPMDVAVGDVAVVDVIVAGAGLAGRLAAAALTDRGVRVALIDDGQPRASDSPAALAHPGLRRSQPELEAASLVGHQALRARLSHFSPDEQAEIVHQAPETGIAHRVVTRPMRRRLSRVLAPQGPRDLAYRERFVDAGWLAICDDTGQDTGDDTGDAAQDAAQDASRGTTPEAGTVPGDQAALVYPQGLALDLNALCEALIAGCPTAIDAAKRRPAARPITLPTRRLRARVTRLARPTSDDRTLWRVTLDQGVSIDARAVVLATGADRESLQQLLADAAIVTGTPLPLRLAAGQLDRFSIAPATPARTPGITRATTGDGFVVPLCVDNDPSQTTGAWVGASYRHDADAGGSDDGQAQPNAVDDTPDAPDHARSPPPASDDETATHRQRLQDALVASNGETPALIHDGVWTGCRAVTPDRLPWIGALDDGLWLLAGFGSHGSTLAPFAAEVAADALSGGIPPWTAAQRAAFDPRRHLTVEDAGVTQRSVGATAS